MLQSGERETEILLGNKQLLGIFFVVATLLGVAFAGGYMVGRGSGLKKTPVVADATAPDAGTNPAATSAVGETHSVAPEDVTSTAGETSSRAGSEEPLGSRRKKSAKAPAIANDAPPASSAHDNFTPQSGQEFLQVAAVPHDHALAVASVLRKKGFRAHAVAKPGDANTYRVIVGPIRNAGELSSTRDSLRKTGFSQVLVQHYQ